MSPRSPRNMDPSLCPCKACALTTTHTASYPNYPRGHRLAHPATLAGGRRPDKWKALLTQSSWSSPWSVLTALPLRPLGLCHLSHHTSSVFLPPHSHFTPYLLLLSWGPEDSQKSSSVPKGKAKTGQFWLGNGCGIVTARIIIYSSVCLKPLLYARCCLGAECTAEKRSAGPALRELAFHKDAQPERDPSCLWCWAQHSRRQGGGRARARVPTCSSIKNSALGRGESLGGRRGGRATQAEGRIRDAAAAMQRPMAQ